MLAEFWQSSMKDVSEQQKNTAASFTFFFLLATCWNKGLLWVSVHGDKRNQFFMCLFFLIVFEVWLWALFSYSPADVNVRYQKKDLNRTEGDTVQFSCMVLYELRECTELSVYWCKRKSMTECAMVSEPDRLLITMNEKDDPKENGTRIRNVIFEMKNISSKDKGSFQCKATCGVTTAEGHIITLSTYGTMTNNLHSQHSVEFICLDCNYIFITNMPDGHIHTHNFSCHEQFLKVQR